MKIAFISFEDIEDPFLWSGIPFTLYSKFKSNLNVNIKAISSYHVKIQFPISVLLKRFFYNKLLAYKFGVYRFDREDWCININTKYINKELKAFNPDVILCCNAYQINQIKTNKPIYIYTDATFKLLNIYYTDYMRYCKSSVMQAELVEKTAFEKAKGIIFSSNWAKNSAIIDYKINPSKIDIIPFGSNLEMPSNYQLKLNKEINRNHFSLLFVGYDYERKGLNKTIAIHQKLILAGVNSKLTIIGANELDEQYDLKNVNFIGKLEMKNPKDALKLLTAFDDAHFLILPTKADCTPIVFSEASSLAIPTVTHSIGGTDEIIKNDINGIILPIESEAELFVEKILFYIDNNQAYQKLRNTTYKVYCERLNWDNTISQLISSFNKNLSN
jgi:glycosyltransferase involved in cell wall biosynthesis